MLLDLTSAILCMRLQGVLTLWKSERLLKTCVDDGSCQMMVVWRPRLGDISRFEPTKSLGTETTQKLLKTSTDMQERMIGPVRFPEWFPGHGFPCSSVLWTGFVCGAEVRYPIRNRSLVERRIVVYVSVSSSGLLGVCFSGSA